jgi:AcrR family transcriptional regulator
MTSEERRQAILDAAVKLFAEKGFRGVTTRELAAAVGVTEPVLYLHFETKRDLYTAIIDRKSQEGKERFGSLLSAHLSTSDDRGFFTNLGKLIVEFHTADPAYIRLLHFASLERHELAEIAYQRQHSTFLDMIAGYIQRRVDEGGLRHVDAHTAAHCFIGMVAHYAQGAVIHHCVDVAATAPQVIPAIVDLFLDGLQRKQSQSL